MGATDEMGSAAVEKSYQVKHVHATVLNQLGIDQNRLTCFQSGLGQRLDGAKQIRRSDSLGRQSFTIGAR